MDRINKKSNASKRFHQVYVQVKSRTSDGRGGLIDTWADSGSFVWASVEPIKASKLNEYRSTNVNATHIITMSAYTTITELNRLRFGSRYFEIKTIENLQEKNVDLFITTEEVRA